MDKFTLKGWKVLVVDDEPDILLLLGYILHLYEADVTCASSGQEAFDLLQKHVFNLGLFDILMPKITGWDLVRAVRESDNIIMRTMPLVAVTALAMSGDRERLLKAGFDAYMAKPIDAEVFAATIRSLVLDEHNGSDPSAGSHKSYDLSDDTLAMADQLRRILQQTQESMNAEPTAFEIEYDMSELLERGYQPLPPAPPISFASFDGTDNRFDQERLSAEVPSTTAEKESTEYADKLAEPVVIQRGLRGFFRRYRHDS